MQQREKGNLVQLLTTAEVLHHKSKGPHVPKKKVQEELLVLAKNEAVKLQADTIIPVSEPVEGSQKYLAYNCVK